jgi:flagellar assembly factor FliW
MKIASPVLGELDVSPEHIIDFPAGLPGFESSKRFTLLHAEGGTPKMFLLQSLDDTELVFSVTTPDVLGLNYEFELGDGEVDALQLGDPADVSVLLIVHRDAAAPAGESPFRANLMAPLVINAASRRGLQKIIGRVDCDVTLRAVG